MAFPFVRNLDTKLLQLSPNDAFTLRDAMNGGVHIFGAPGSGKSSGSGEALAAAYLRAGMGGIVCVAKPEDVALWIARARKHGREKSLVIFDETRGFNFIDYELAKQGPQGVSNVTECLMRVLESADQATANTGTATDPFWPQATRQVLNYCLPAIYAAHGKVTVKNLIDFATAAPTKAEEYSEPDSGNYAVQTLRKVVKSPTVPMDPDVQRSMLEFWFDQFPAIPIKTKGNILISLSARLDRFKHGRLRKCFCDATDIVPEMTFQGAIIILAMPVLSWNEDGIMGQQLFKFMWQRAVEFRNNLDASQRERPVFEFIDEAQYFVSVRDDEFLSTCRASRACPVFLTQTLPSYYARLGKDKTDAADGLVGKFATQVFHLNACPRTAEHASKTIGKVLHRRRSESRSQGTTNSRGMNAGANTSAGSSSGFGSSSGGNSHSFSHNSGSNSSSGNSWGDNVGQGTSENSSSGFSEQNDFIVEPRFFSTGLKAGGPENDHLVTAVWFKAGGDFRDGEGGNFLVPTFRQES